MMGRSDPSPSVFCPAAPTPDQVREALRLVIDPEIGVNIVDLGLVYGIAVRAATCASTSR